MKLAPNSKKLSCSGKIGWKNPSEPVFIYSCTSARMRLTGKILRIFVKNRSIYEEGYLGYILDGSQSALTLPKKGEAVLGLPVERAE